MVKINCHEVVSCIIYSPNTDSPQIFENTQTHIDDMQCQNIIWCGDFNLVLNPNLDCYNYKCINYTKARETISEMILIIIDILGGKNLHLHKVDWISFYFLYYCYLVWILDILSLGTDQITQQFPCH